MHYHFADPTPNRYLGKNVYLIPPGWFKRRTWRDRLFSRPWRPLRSHVFVANPAYKRGKILQTPSAWYMTPDVWDTIRRFAYEA